ncbi:hypothetical protein [Longispora albida]|uniref:hypothetical protein n=1 Tax=Longispora albida TaxID=203523 RepID=UPI0003615F57|nr:hypothetical protein [Longispora albida]
MTLPIAGVALVVLGLLILPWQKDTWLYEIATGVADTGPHSFGESYVLFLAYPSLIFGGLLAFAANLDSGVFRWLHFAFGALATCGAGTLGVLGAGIVAAMSGEGQAAENGGAAMGVLVGVCFVVFLSMLGFAFLKGLALRIVGGLMLLGYGLTSALGVVSLYEGAAAGPYPSAFLPALGWLFCAVGAFTGPKYEYR